MIPVTYLIATIAALLALVIVLLVGYARTRGELARLRKRWSPVLDLHAEAMRIRRDAEVAAQQLTVLRESIQAEQRKSEDLLAAHRRTAEVERQNLTVELQNRRLQWERDFSSAIAELESLHRQVGQARDHVEMQSFGLYDPVFDFETAEMYQRKLSEVVAMQKAMVKGKTAAVCGTAWSVGGSAAEGKRLAERNLKLQLRAFNGESDAIISKVKFNNVVAIAERLRKSFTQLNDLGKTVNCAISEAYLGLKLQELYLTHEHAEKRQKEKEEQLRIKEQMREEEQAQRELERAQTEALREEKRWADALEKARLELSKAGDKKRNQLEAKVAELQQKLAEAHEVTERAVSRAQLTKSGHVYIISNEGSFGRGVYKIGMTRREDPLDRVKELGDASVPFSFDVHAMIPSADAPDLECKLQQAFGHRRVNLVNQRKEFFTVSLEEIEAMVRNIHGEVEFVRTAIAEEYRKTMAVRAEHEAAAATAQKNAEEEAVRAARDKFEALRVGWYAEPVHQAVRATGT